MAAFATPTELSAWTAGKIAVSDPRSQALLDGISEAARRYCGWHISPSQTDTIVLDGTDSALLYLPSIKVTAVTSVTEAGDLIDTDDYEWSAVGVVRRISTYPYLWSDSFRDISVVYTHGFSSVPDVKKVVLSAAARGLASPMGARTEQAGSVSVTWSTASFSNDEVAILNSYRLPRRP